mmetsp:Transcript_47110/g.47555  ORF Transcript_47110/g.47555 Transcript_47110/m.47555 type:complete len:91 (+) Transcript_47110:383-655(+)
MAYTLGIRGTLWGGVTLDPCVHNSGLKMPLDVVIDVVGDKDHDRVFSILFILVVALLQSSSNYVSPILSKLTMTRNSRASRLSSAFCFPK